jgi:hypothetical protein
MSEQFSRNELVKISIEKLSIKLSLCLKKFTVMVQHLWIANVNKSTLEALLKLKNYSFR